MVSIRAAFHEIWETLEAQHAVRVGPDEDELKGRNHSAAARPGWRRHNEPRRAEGQSPEEPILGLGQIP